MLSKPDEEFVEEMESTRGKQVDKGELNELIDALRKEKYELEMKLASLQEQLSESMSKVVTLEEQLHPKTENRDHVDGQAVTIGRMFMYISKLANFHLVDTDLKWKKSLTCFLWDSKYTFYTCWSAILTLSKTPLAIELQEKLRDAGISHEDFCRNIEVVYNVLKSQHYYYFDFQEKIEPQDVKNTIKLLKFDSTQYECLKILYGLHDDYGWKI